MNHLQSCRGVACDDLNECDCPGFCSECGERCEEFGATLCAACSQPVARSWQLFGQAPHYWEPIPDDCRTMTARAYCDATGEEYDPQADDGESLLLVREYGEGKLESVGNAWGVEELQPENGTLHADDCGFLRTGSLDKCSCPPPVADRALPAELLRRIADTLDGKEWSGETCEQIAAVLREGGFHIRDVDGFDEVDPYHARDVAESGAVCDCTVSASDGSCPCGRS